MTIGRFQRVNVTDKALSRIQDQIGDTLDNVTARAVIDGVLIQNVPLSSAGTNYVEHKLGRAPMGWFVTNFRANVAVWKEETDDNSPKLLLPLKCSTDCTVDLWVF